MGCPVLVDTVTMILNVDEWNDVFLIKGVRKVYILEERE